MLVWVIDILNIGTNIFGFNLAEFLDVTLPINFWAWLLIWLFVPTRTTIVNKEK